LFNDEIELGNLVETVEYGEVIRTKTWALRMCNHLNDERSEFYQAARAGLKPQLTFEIHDFEYNNEEYIRYPAGSGGTEYTIIRAAKRDDMRELVCSAHTGSEV